VRRVPRSFAWIDTRLRSDGFLELMRPAEIGLYLFLALAADERGLSCWRMDRIERALPCFDLVSLRQARQELLHWNLLAYQPWHSSAVDGSYQLLAVPAPPPKPPQSSGPVSVGDLLSGFGGVGR
jgi:hypothetical protein